MPRVPRFRPARIRPCYSETAHFHDCLLSSRLMAHRTFTDSAGRLWEVWTVVPSHAERGQALENDAKWNARERREHRQQRVLLGEPGAHGWLPFQPRGEKRRLTPYPEHW